MDSINHIIADMPNEEYHEHPAISKSGLDLIHRSPLHYYCEKLGEDAEKKRKKTKAMDIGTAFHILALEPDKFDTHVAVSPKLDLRTVKGKETFEDFCASNAGKIILRHDDMEDMREMAKSIREHKAARYLLQGKGMVEASMFFREEIYQVDCRIRPDWMRDDGLLIDIKTTENAAPEQFDRHFWNYRYHVQAAFYLDGYAAVHGRPAQGFTFIAVEKSPPYAVSVRLITEEYALIGRRAYMQDIEQFAKCQAEHAWPGYGDDVREIQPPAWANNL